MVARSLRRKVSTGRQGLIGREATVVEPLVAGAGGMVRCRGELWRARVEAGEDALAEGDTGIVSDLDGIVLVIRGKRGRGAS